MQTWATLAAKHATLTSGIGLGAIPAMGWDSVDGFAVGVLMAWVGFAALNSPRRVGSCSLPRLHHGRAGHPEARGSEGGRLTRARRRVDGLLTGMLSDDSDVMTMATQTWDTDPATADQTPVPPEPASPQAEAARPDPARPDPARPDPARPDPAQPDPARLDSAQPAKPAWSPERTFAPDPAARPYATTGDATSALAAPREPGSEQEQAAPALEPLPEPERAKLLMAAPVRDSVPDPEPAGGAEPGPESRRRSERGFWGPDRGSEEPAGAAPGSGYRSKHRADEQAAESRPQDGRRGKPRHAAPPASFGVTVGRRLTSPKLTSRSAAHAGG